ncbi:MAG: HNH endonuclease [Gemmataceae bacterium]|nr:HNH endonuclease [Gemmataceae bacterium]
MNPHYSVVAERAGHRCEYCHAPEAIFNFPFEVEHITPVSRQGANEESNLALACRACNLHKADHLAGEDEHTGKTVRLFHPRQDRWKDHFQVDRETGVIRGRTAVGRVTATRLNLNSPLQLDARQQWMRLGLFP